MKQTVFAIIGAAAVAAAQPAHQHGHQHLHHPKRDQSTPVEVVNVPGPTVVVYELAGRLITEDEVQQGLQNGSLVMAKDGQLSSAPVASSYAQSTQAPYVAPSSSSSSIWIQPASTIVASSSSSVWVQPSSSSSAYVAPSSYAASSSSAQASSPSSYSSGNSTDDDDDNHPGNGLDEDFPDGELDCSHFPEDYGAIPVDWAGLGGWTGVQQPGSFLNGFANIKTALTGESCTEGSYCSYACPAGYQKAQWPSDQGSTGQSVGGILCKGGKLHLTNSAMSKKLCMAGTAEVDIKIENNVSDNVAVCRTDYPGTESETVPLNTKPGKTYPLTCPDADNYYNWKGGKTSAQYYVNPMGVAVKDACQWGSSANPWGNFAPMNLGVGYSGGRAWLSIFQNSPTTDAKLDFTVEIKGGDDMSGSCKYSNGQYCSDTGCSTTTGCTVSSYSPNSSILKKDRFTNNQSRSPSALAPPPSSSRRRYETNACISTRMKQAGPALPRHLHTNLLPIKNQPNIKAAPGVQLCSQSDVSPRPAWQALFGHAHNNMTEHIWKKEKTHRIATAPQSAISRRNPLDASFLGRPLSSFRKNPFSIKQVTILETPKTKKNK